MTSCKKILKHFDDYMTENIKKICGRKYITFMYGNNLKDLYVVKESRWISIFLILSCIINKAFKC